MQCDEKGTVYPGQTTRSTHFVTEVILNRFDRGKYAVLVLAYGKTCAAHWQTVSRYDERYFCSIRKVSRIGVDGINVDFEVSGDGSLGPLQVWDIQIL